MSKTWSPFCNNILPRCVRQEFEDFQQLFKRTVSHQTGWVLFLIYLLADVATAINSHNLMGIEDNLHN